jgi:citronellol/citronellal dehydrogenase
LAIRCDIRDEESVNKEIELIVKTFGGINILVNNASAICLTITEETHLKRFYLIMSINTRWTLLCSKYCISYLKKS